MSTTVQCRCSNCTITIKSFCMKNEIPEPMPCHQWNEPMYTSMGLLTWKYPALKSISTSNEHSQYVTVTCEFCHMVVCHVIPLFLETLDTSMIINPSLRTIAEQREELEYSSHFGLYMKKNECPNELIDVCDFSNDDDEMLMNPIAKKLCRHCEIFQEKKHQIINGLYEEKERKVREFVLEQEESFEEKRYEVKRHYLLLKKMMSSTESVFDSWGYSLPSSKDVLPQEQQENCIEEEIETKTNEYERDVFMFEEEEGLLNYQSSGNILEELKKQGKNDNRIFGIEKVKKQKSFPTSFREYTMAQVNNPCDDY